MSKRLVFLVGGTAALFTVIFGTSPSLVRAQYESCIPCVLIDPGHGGTDASGGYNLGATCWSNMCSENARGGGRGRR